LVTPFGRNKCCGRSAALEVLTEQHPNIDFVVADVASPDDATRTVTTVVDRWGRLDVLVNNAGAGAILP